MVGSNPFSPRPEAPVSGLPFARPAVAEVSAAAGADCVPAGAGLGAGADPLAAALAARFGRVGGRHAVRLRRPRCGTAGPPSQVSVPEGYEAGYAYPLVVWLHDTGQSEHTLHPVMRRVSDRNYLGPERPRGRL